MLSQEKVDKFYRDGFVLGEKVISDDEIRVLRDEVLRVIDDRERTDIPQPVLCRNLAGGDRPVWQIVNIWMASTAFERLIHNETLLAMAAQLSDNARELRIWHDQVQYKPAEFGGSTTWHQDSPLWPPLTPKTAQFSAWIALDDVHLDNGCMSMVPGSYKWGNKIESLGKINNEMIANRPIRTFLDLPEEFEGHDIRVKTCPVPAGYVHFHHALTWHGSHDNHSGRPRRAIAIHFMTDQTMHDSTKQHVMSKFISVGHMEKMQGDAFPLLWSAQPATV